MSDTITQNSTGKLASVLTADNLSAAASGKNGVTILNTDVFNDVFDEALLNTFDKRTIMDMRYIWSIFNKGLSAARAGKMETAQLEFERGESVITSTVRDEKVSCFLKTYTLPNHAYYYYKAGAYDKAYQMTWDTLFNLEQMEEEVVVLHMGKIQQLHNIARMQFRQKKAAEALSTNNQLLRYLSRGDIPEQPGLWTLELLKKTPLKLQSDMFFQVFSELAYNMYRYYKKDEAAFFKAGFGNIIPFGFELFESDAYVTWLKAKEAYFSGDMLLFADLAAKHLESAAHKFDVLKLSLLRNIIQSSTELSEHDGKPLGELAVAFARKHIRAAEDLIDAVAT